MSDQPPGLDRFGHLTELSLNRLVEDAPASDPAFFAIARAHLASCERCRGFAAEFQAADAVPMAPSPAVMRAALPSLAARRRVIAAVGGALAIAATVFLVVRAQPEPDGLRTKGAAFHLQVHVSDGAGTRVVGDGDAIHARQRAGFSARSQTAGHLLVFGWDHTGVPYPIFPDAPDVRAARAQPIAAHDALVPLDAAVEFDGEPGAEHLYAVFCEQPFGFEALGVGASVSGAPAAPVGCVAKSIVLHKSP